METNKTLWDRGATTVEYVLVLTLLVCACLIGIDYLRVEEKEGIQGEANCIGYAPNDLEYYHPECTYSGSH